MTGKSAGVGELTTRFVVLVSSSAQPYGRRTESCFEGYWFGSRFCH